MKDNVIKKILNGKILTVPNLLSVFRILMAVLFFVLYRRDRALLANWPAILCLALNALSDLVDGKIARALHQVSDLGKVLDPFADYVTKFFLILCLIRAYPFLILFLALFLFRVLYVDFLCLRYTQATGEASGAIFVGKADTMVFYIVMLLIILFPLLPVWLVYTLVCVSAALMIASVILYTRRSAALRSKKQG